MKTGAKKAWSTVAGGVINMKKGIDFNKKAFEYYMA
ncbi:hypothetical protein COJ45_03090, partial [Bacillus cereus]